MEIEAFNGYIPNNYPIMMSASSDHGNVYASYNYQFPSDNLVWNSPDTFVNQSELSVSSPSLTSTSFYYQSSNLNSTNSDENHAISTVESSVKNKRGRKKGSKKVEQPKADDGSEKGSESPPNPVVMKKRRLAANARERRRMNGLNTAFDR
jgi:hypothetical protein